MSFKIKVKAKVKIENACSERWKVSCFAEAPQDRKFKSLPIKGI